MAIYKNKTDKPVPFRAIGVVRLVATGMAIELSASEYADGGPGVFDLIEIGVEELEATLAEQAATIEVDVETPVETIVTEVETIVTEVETEAEAKKARKKA